MLAENGEGLHGVEKTQQEAAGSPPPHPQVRGHLGTSRSLESVLLLLSCQLPRPSSIPGVTHLGCPLAQKQVAKAEGRRLGPLRSQWGRGAGGTPPQGGPVPQPRCGAGRVQVAGPRDLQRLAESTATDS